MEECIANPDPKEPPKIHRLDEAVVNRIAAGFQFTIDSFSFFKVNWDDEKTCFQTIAAAIGNFYAFYPPLLPNPSGEGLQFYKDVSRGDPEVGNPSENAEDVDEEIECELLLEAESAWSQREWSIQHVLFPSMRLFLKSPVSMATNGTFIKVASLEKLYRIFERC